MTNIVKQFIENNIKLIDSGLWNEFCANMWSELDSIQSEELVESLRACDINFDKEREAYLYYVCSMQIESIKDEGVRDRITIPYFISTYLQNLLGFSYEYIVAYLLDNAEEFDCTTDGKNILYLR